MYEYTKDILSDLEEDLSVIEYEERGRMKQSEKAIGVLYGVISDLRTKLAEHQFKESKIEIAFFKELLPEFYSRLIYYLRVFHLESKRPKASIKLQKKIFRHELDDIALFLEHHAGFLQYYNAGSTYLDQSFFTRSAMTTEPPPYMLDDWSLALDTSFCTTHSFIVAKIKAFEQVQSYILKELYSLDNNNMAIIDEDRVEPVKCPLGPFALTELGYMLHLTGAVPGSLKQAMEFVGKCFSTKINNYSRILQQIRIRKSAERAVFLQKGLELFNDHMEKLDDNVG